MKKLEQIRQESKEIKDKIDDTEERLRQLKNQEKKIIDKCCFFQSGFIRNIIFIQRLC